MRTDSGPSLLQSSDKPLVYLHAPDNYTNCTAAFAKADCMAEPHADYSPQNEYIVESLQLQRRAYDFGRMIDPVKMAPKALIYYQCAGRQPLCSCTLNN